MLDLSKLLKVARSHFDGIPLLMDAAAKFGDAKNAKEVVDAVVPVEYKAAAIFDDYNSPMSQGVGDDDVVAAKARFCEAYNGAPPADGVVSEKALLTPERLDGILKLLLALAPLLLKR